MLMSTESVLIYRFYKIYSPLEYTGHSLRKEELKNFSPIKDVNNSFTTIIYIICYVLSGLFFDVITCFYFDTNSISTAIFKEKAAV